MRTALCLAFFLAIGLSARAATERILRVEVITFATPNAEPEVTDEILAELLASGRVSGVTVLSLFEVQPSREPMEVNREFAIGDGKALVCSFRAELGADHSTVELAEIRIGTKDVSSGERVTWLASATRVAFADLPIVELVHVEAGSAVTRHYGVRITLEPKT